MYYLNCGCVARGNDFVMIKSSVECTDNDNITTQQTSIRHLVKLPYISAFVDQIWLKEIQGNKLLNVAIKADFPPLLIQDPKYTHLLADDKKYSVDMDLAINRSKASVKVFGDLADYLYSVIVSEKQLPGTFSWFSGWTWLSLITSAVAAFSLFLGITQHLKIKALYLVIATLEKSHALPTEMIVNYHVITTPTEGTVTALGFQHYVTMVAD